MSKSAATSNQELLSRLDERVGNMLAQLAEFRAEYKEISTEIKHKQDIQFGEISRKQDEQFAAVLKRIQDIETWKATEVQPTRIMKWDEAAKRVDDYLDNKHVARRERVFTAVEPHINKDGNLEGIVWLERTRDRWGFLLAIVGGFLGILSGLFYWLLDNVIVPFFNHKGGL